MTESTQGANGRVFISYSRKDKAFVQKLNDALDNAGVHAWVDWEGIELASDWMETITSAIQNNDAFLFVISPDSLKSKVCTDELELGIRLNKKLIPILYRPPTRGQTLHEKIASTNWVYMRKEDNFEETLPKLIQSVNTDLGWVRRHTRLLEQSLEWEEKSRNNSFLLNGTELEDAEKWLAEASGHVNRQVLPLQAEYITASRRYADRRQRTVLAGVSLALVVSIVLSIFAWIARSDAKHAQAIAQTSEALAITNQHAASTAQVVAEENQKIAEQKKQEADEKTNLANASKSAAQSQIYQSRPGELDSSTLLAIDSYQRVPSFQAEDLIRTNISQMALPIKQMKQDGAIWNIEWAPDYKTFVTGNHSDPTIASPVYQACVWNVEDGAQVYCVRHDADVNDAIFTHDGKYLVTASADKTVRFWDAATGKAIESMTLTFGGSVNDLDVSNSVLAIAREDDFLTLYYLDKPDVKPVQREFDSGVYQVRFAPNNDFLAIALSNGEVKFWQARNNYFYNGPKHPLGGYAIVSFSPDSNWLASGGGDSLVRLTRRDGTVQYQVPHGDWVEDIAFGPDPSWYVTVSDDNKVRVLDTTTGHEKLRMSHAGFAQKVKVSFDGQWIASTGYDNVVRVWDAASGSQMLEIPLDANGTALAFNKDGTRIIAADKNGNISIWDISTLAAQVGHIEFPEYVHEARFTPSGEYLFVNSDDYNVWRIPANDVSQITDGTQGKIILVASSLTYNMAVSLDSKWVGVVEFNSASSQNDAATLVSVDGQTKFPLPHGGRVTGIAFDRESKRVITSGANGKIDFWDVQTGAKQSLELDNAEAVNSLAANPTNSMLAAGLHDKITIWNYESGSKAAELSQAGDITAIAFSQDGKLLATGNAEGAVMIWKVEDESFAQVGNPLQLEGKPLLLAFSPDDKVLAGGGSSGFAYLWDTVTAQEVARIPHSDPVTSVSFSLDGTQLFTVSRKVVRIWALSSIRQMPKDELIPLACAHLTSNISKDDWASLFGSEEYKLICPDLLRGKK